MIDIEGMKQDRAAHKKEKFTPENHLIHGLSANTGSRRQTSKQRQRRLEKFMRSLAPDQVIDQARRHWEQAGRKYRVMAWSI